MGLFCCLRLPNSRLQICPIQMSFIKLGNCYELHVLFALCRALSLQVRPNIIFLWCAND